MIETGSDFSGVGAFDQALIKLGIKYKTVFACDMDKYARQTYIENYGQPDYYPENVYDREIPEKSLDIFCTSPPCQSFSLAGKRKGEDSVNGVLFYNSHEFIIKNNPRYFIFENVKGLLSDANGRTFQIWVDMLGGKSVNGNPVIFPREDAAPYHIYHKVLNAKHFGVPQNRERIFIIGIRDDQDNNFSFPKPFPLKKRLKDVLETDVDEKYYLSDKMLESISKWNSNQNPLDNIFDENSIMSCVLARGDGETHAGMKLLKVKSATKKGYETAKEGDSINLSQPNSETRRGRVGKEVAQTLDTSCNQGVMQKIHNWYDKENKSKEIGDIIQTGQTNMNGQGIYKTGISPTLPAENPRVVNVLKDYNIRKLTPRECFRLMDFPDTFMDKLFVKKTLYFQFVYSKFDKNKKETVCNAKLKIVPENQIHENLETSVLCTTKECQKLEQLKINSTKIKSKESLLNVNFAIEKLGELEQKECVINITKWTDYTEILYALMKEGKNQVVVDISETQKESKSIEKLWKITWEENLSEVKLCIILILLRQTMQSKIFTYAKMPQNTRRYITSTIDLEKGLENLHLLSLKMEYTKQLISDTMLYKQAGNSIVVNVLAQIINKLNKIA
jgi:DNA (cytosine-5)-methyltransferase 1